MDTVGSTFLVVLVREDGSASPIGPVPSQEAGKQVIEAYRKFRQRGQTLGKVKRAAKEYRLVEITADLPAVFTVAEDINPAPSQQAQQAEQEQSFVN